MDWEKIEEAVSDLKRGLQGLEKCVAERDDYFADFEAEEMQGLLKKITTALSQDS